MIESQNVRDTAHFATHEPRSVAATTLRETAFINDILAVTPGFSVHEVMHVNDYVVQSAYSLLHETAQLGDAVHPNVHIFGLAHETARFADRISAWRDVFQISRDTAIVHGYAVAPPSAALHETARILGYAAATGAVTGATLHELARLGDAVHPANSARLHEVARLNDGYATRNRAGYVVRDLALLDDTAFPIFITNVVLRDTARFNDWLSSSAARQALLHEVFYVDDRALPPASGRAYTCSVLTWGMSVYLNYPFLTKAGNYAAGANLWRLDAVKDYNAEIEAWVTPGALDMGQSRGKRPAALYAAGSSSEPLTVVVTGDVYGAQAEYSYTLDLRDQTNYRNNRAILGKGFRSRYLQFKLHAGKYIGLRLLNAEVDVAVSPRRVG